MIINIITQPRMEPTKMYIDSSNSTTLSPINKHSNANKLQLDQHQTLWDKRMQASRTKKHYKGGGEWVVWESRSSKRKQTRLGRREHKKEQGGRIPGLYPPDEFESMWQCVSLRNAYVNPPHTHPPTHPPQKNRLTPYSSNFLSFPVTWMNPINPNALCFNHSG